MSNRTLQQKKMEGEELESTFERYFARVMQAHVIIWILANCEMTVDLAAKFISQFRNPALRNQFLGKVFNYSLYRLIPSNDEAQAELGELSNENEDFTKKVKENIKDVLENTDEGQNGSLYTGIPRKVRKVLQETKLEWLSNSSFRLEQFSKTQYLKQLIQKIIEKFGKDYEQGLAEKIISSGGLHSVITLPIFSQDISFRQRFKNILNNCNTYKELKRFGGEDIVVMRKKLTEAILICLTELDFDEESVEQISQELLRNPLSNIVAAKEQLTNKQKQKYYTSQFYRSGKIRKYCQTIQYEESLDYKTKEDMSKILKLIEEEGRVTKQIMDCVINFKFFDLLKVATIRYLKKTIFDFVVNECPGYFSVFKKIKYQNKTPAQFRENEQSTLKFNLVNIFMRIKLPFEEWQIAQDKIMTRKYTIIDELTLKLKDKFQLMSHIQSEIEPYFYRQEKQMDFRSEVELNLLKALMATNISDVNFENILNIIQETLDSETNTSDYVKELGRLMQRSYTDAVSSNAAFREYVGNKRRDVKEIQYKKKWEMVAQIYQINLEDRIDVDYQTIEEFIEETIRNGGVIPKNYHHYITDLTKLRGESMEPIEPIVEEEEKEEEKEEIKQDLNQSLAETAQNLIQTYVKANEDSMFEKVYKDNFANNAEKMVRRIIETNATNNPSSIFFTELGLNNLKCNRLKTEISNNKALISADLEKCKAILQRLGVSNGVSSQSPPPPVERHQAGLNPEEFAIKATEFVTKYMSAHEDSMLQRVWNDKYGKDNAKLVRALIDNNAFGDPNSSFFSGVGLNALLTKRMRAEFTANSAQALSTLSLLR